MTGLILKAGSLSGLLRSLKCAQRALMDTQTRWILPRALQQLLKSAPDGQGYRLELVVSRWSQIATASMFIAGKACTMIAQPSLSSRAEKGPGNIESV